MPVFRFFNEEAHAKAFLSGKLRFQPLSHFRTLEAQEGVRGDKVDGVLTYALPRGLPLTFQDGRTQVFNGSFIAVPRQEVFVLCASNHVSAAVSDGFGRFCVEFDPEVVLNRLRKRACPTARFDYEHVVGGKVDYRPNHRSPGVDWALPERLALTKPEGFAWQDEYRIAVPTRGAFAVENVDLVMYSGEGAPPAGPLSGGLPVFLKLGSIRDCAVLHTM